MRKAPVRLVARFVVFFMAILMTQDARGQGPAFEHNARLGRRVNIPSYERMDADDYRAIHILQFNLKESFRDTSSH
jgi:hypothetical protein